MKNIISFQLFETFQLNEIKSGFTSVAKSDKILDSIDKALKGNLFFYANLGKKIYMKEGGKRPVSVHTFNQSKAITSNSDVKDLGKEISFVEDYVTYTVPKNQIETWTKEDYLKHRLEILFNQLHANKSNDSHWNDEAQAAGSTNVKGKEHVSPYIDCGFIVWFADKYKIDLKQFMEDQRYTMSYNEIIEIAKKYPFKK